MKAGWLPIIDDCPAELADVPGLRQARTALLSPLEL
jgi:hypothetical protein